MGTDKKLIRKVAIKVKRCNKPATCDEVIKLWEVM